ncbi:MAG: SDR family oxidoreductase [Acidobacteriota bacterium]|nr:SDR family oxidoreductase [Acidobacteriota bacterium]
MAVRLKNLNEQVMVITGATSGIGLVTSRMAAKRGAKLVLAARNEDALRTLTNEINASGGKAVYIAADVGKEGDIKKIAAEALSQFGNFDTWVNNAGVSIYGKLEEVPTEDSRQLFETNFWGLVYGSLIAARTLKISGGALINIGSTLSDRAIPLQGMYCASKHAVKGFTDSLRMELESENAPVSVTLIKPAAIDTPYKEHAKNYLGVEPENPPPVYAPETVAETILHCAENPVRDVFVGAGGKALSLLGKFAPRTTDKYMEAAMIDMQKSDKPTNGESNDGLYDASDLTLNERGGYEGHVAESSIYTKASLHPFITGAAFAIGAAGIAYALMSRGDKDAVYVSQRALEEESRRKSLESVGDEALSGRSHIY